MDLFEFVDPNNLCLFTDFLMYGVLILGFTEFCLVSAFMCSASASPVFFLSIALLFEDGDLLLRFRVQGICML